MITIKTQSNLGSAKNYFKEHLNSGDYYESGGQTPGTWHGQGADMLGLAGNVREKDFLSLCAGQKPDGSKLTQRHNTVRTGDVANRRVFYDFTICPPKSVSIAALVEGDERIMRAHAQAVAVAAAEMETFAVVRLRAKSVALNGREQKTGNLLMAAFTHESARAVSEGANPDPLLHTHLLVFNASFDKSTNEWRALEPRDLFRANQYIESVFDHALCRELKKMGYQLREKGKGWELAHIPDSLCETFSKRRKAILEKTAELEKEGAKSGHEKIKDSAAHDQRIRKQGSQSADELRQAWKNQMTKQEKNNLIVAAIYSSNDITPNDAVEWSQKHLFERNAVVPRTEFLASCLKHGRGGDFSLSALKATFDAESSILHEIGGDRITTEDALETERFILRTVLNGKSRYEPFASGLLSSADSLNPLQRSAAEKLLAGRDFLSVFRGGAGTGKSYTMKHVRDALQAGGNTVVVLAPQNQQVADLIKDGFEAQTVASFLAGAVDLNSETVVFCDEAGQVGGEDMAKMLSKIKAGNARCVLVGDVRQHGSVARSSALVAIQKYASPHTAELAGEYAIQRQQVAGYRKAVAAAECGDTARAWDLLDQQGSIIDTTVENRTRDAARLYVEKLNSGGSVLVLSQTNVEVDALNQAIRQELGACGRLDPQSAFLKPTLKQVDLTNAEKERGSNYPDGAVVLLNRKVGHFRGGTSGEFLRESVNGGVVLLVGGKELTVSNADLDRLTVCEKLNLQLCAGDKIQLKANIRLSKKKKLANGQILDVVGEDKFGDLLVKDAHGQRFALPGEFKRFQYGYAVSSYASQGKTCDAVIVSDSMCKAATNTREFYVSISRGKHSCSILTADRYSLQAHIESLGDRALASDLQLEPRHSAPTIGEGDMTLEQLKPHLGDPTRKERVLCNDSKTGQRMELFGNRYGSLIVRGLSELSDCIVRGFGRIRGIISEREHEPEMER